MTNPTDADHWRTKYHAMRREVRRANKALNLWVKVAELSAMRNMQLRDQLTECQKELARRVADAEQ